MPVKQDLQARAAAKAQERAAKAARNPQKVWEDNIQEECEKAIDNGHTSARMLVMAGDKAEFDAAIAALGLSVEEAQIPNEEGVVVKHGVKITWD